MAATAVEELDAVRSKASVSWLGISTGRSEAGAKQGLVHDAEEKLHEDFMSQARTNISSIRHY